MCLSYKVCYWTPPKDCKTLISMVTLKFTVWPKEDLAPSATLVQLYSEEQILHPLKRSIIDSQCNKKLNCIWKWSSMIHFYIEVRIPWPQILCSTCLVFLVFCLLVWLSFEVCSFVCFWDVVHPHVSHQHVPHDCLELIIHTRLGSNLQQSSY